MTTLMNCLQYTEQKTHSHSHHHSVSRSSTQQMLAAPAVSGPPVPPDPAKVIQRILFKVTPSLRVVT